MTTRIELAGIEMKNPMLLASGILDETPATLKRMARNEVGAVVTKSIGPVPRDGNVSPVLLEVPSGLLNSMGLPNPGIDDFVEEFPGQQEIGVPVVLSIFAGTAKEFASIAKETTKVDISAIELNLSCPNATGLGQEIGQDPERITDITKQVKAESNVPVFVKLTPNITDIRPLAMAAQDGGADAIVAINTLKGMAIDARARMPILGNKFGGLSGPAIKPVALRMVYEICSQEGFDTPVIGCGGASTAVDIIEFILAGATAVEVGTAVYDRGVEVFKKLQFELDTFLEEEGIEDINTLRGQALGGGN